MRTVTTPDASTALWSTTLDDRDELTLLIRLYFLTKYHNVFNISEIVELLGNVTARWCYDFFVRLF